MSNQRAGSLDDIEYLYHCTNIKYLKSILKHGKLLNNTSRNASPDEHVRTATGEGSAGRRVAHAKVSVGNPDFWRGDDAPSDADGVYFRLVGLACYSEDHIMLAFDRAILDDSSCTWHINTTENNGFYLNEPGIKALSPFSGDMGITYDRSNADKYDMPAKNQELVVAENVSLRYLNHIRVNNEKMAAKVRSLTDLPIFVSLK